jgi:hypothetical protein
LKIKILSLGGQLLKEIEGSREPGWHQVIWDMRKPGSPRSRQRVEPGVYRLILEVDQQKFEQQALITKRISWSLGPQPVVIKEASWIDN